MDLKLGEVTSLIIFYNITIFWLHPPNGFQFNLRDCATQEYSRFSVLLDSTLRCGVIITSSLSLFAYHKNVNNFKTKDDIHGNNFIDTNYRLMHSVNELSGFTCTSSLTMNDNSRAMSALTFLLFKLNTLQKNPSNFESTKAMG